MINTDTIAQAVKSALQTGFANRTPETIVDVEVEFQPRESWIGVYLDRIEEPPDQQPLTAGRKARMLVRFQVWCWRLGMTNAQASENRDALTGDAELALMLDRTLGGVVSTCWLEGGRFNKSEDPQQLGRFFAGGEIILVCDVLANTL